MSIAPVSRRTYLTACAAFAAACLGVRYSAAPAVASLAPGAGGGTSGMPLAIKTYRDMRVVKVEYHPITKAVRSMWANAAGDELQITSRASSVVASFVFDAETRGTYHTIEQTIYPEHQSAAEPTRTPCVHPNWRGDECRCQYQMGNDFYFLPADRCLYDDK